MGAVEEKLGERQVGLEGTERIWILLTASWPVGLHKETQQWGPGDALWIPQMACCTPGALHASRHISPSCGQLLGHAHDGGVSKPWQMASGGHPETWTILPGQGETTKLSFSSILRAKKRLPALNLVCCNIESRHAKLRILPQEGEIRAEQEYPGKTGLRKPQNP